MKDQMIEAAIEKEAKRQLYNIELIASENYVSKMYYRQLEVS